MGKMYVKMNKCDITKRGDRAGPGCGGEHEHRLDMLSLRGINTWIRSQEDRSWLRHKGFHLHLCPECSHVCAWCACLEPPKKIPKAIIKEVLQVPRE